MKYERITRKDWKEHMQERRCIASNEALTRLGELEDKIENGTLIELPCKVGDTIYTIEFISSWTDYIIEQHTILDISINNTNTQDVELFFMVDYESVCKVPIGFFKEDYNVTWFIDLKLAEQKLEELNNEKI